MTFREMRKRLIEQGFLDKDGKLTQKGHDYVKGAIKVYDKRVKPFNWEEPAIEEDKHEKYQIRIWT